ncbi:MAG: hypothetical protein R6X17_02130 [Candidatus Competibacteraceae bacterium]
MAISCAKSRSLIVTGSVARIGVLSISEVIATLPLPFIRTPHYSIKDVETCIGIGHGVCP